MGKGTQPREGPTGACSQYALATAKVPRFGWIVQQETDSPLQSVGTSDLRLASGARCCGSSSNGVYVNSLFSDLLRITPFSADEATNYGRFLADRNLLVHHGGIYTFKYASQRFARRRSGTVHWKSLVVGKKEFRQWRKFLLGMGRKIANVSRAAIEQFADQTHIKFSASQRRALIFLNT